MSGNSKKLVFVTGAGRGIGRTIALRLAQEGYVVAGCARSMNELEETRNISEGKIEIAAVDVTDPDQLQGWFKKVIEKHANLSPWGLVTAAGVYGPIGKFFDNDWKAWKNSVDINLYGTLLSVKFFSLALIEKKLPGRVVLLSGGGATKPIPHFSSYCATKAAVVRFGETAAHELMPYQITINSIAPGAINTKLLDDLLRAGRDSAGDAMYETALKQKENGGQSPDKAAALVSYLLGPNGGGITGRLIAAIWDEWDKFHLWADKIEKSDVFTLRRIIPEDRKVL